MLNGPASIQTTENHLTLNAKFFSPIRHALRSTIMSQQTILSIVASLFLIGCPFAVRGPAITDTFFAVSTRIMSAVIYAVDGVIERRSKTQIVDKVSEATPSCTNTDTASAVMLKSIGPFILAASMNSLPDTVFKRMNMLQAVSCIAPYHHGAYFTTLQAIRQDEDMIRSAWKHAANIKDNLQRFDGGGGVARFDFTDVKFGEGITWDTHVAIDPDRCYGINPADIDVYELMKFGAYARDTLQVRQYTSGGTYYDQWIGFLGCKYDLGAKRFGSHWLLNNLDITGLPSPAVAFA